MHGSVCIWDCAESACEAVRQDDRLTACKSVVSHGFASLLG